MYNAARSENDSEKESSSAVETCVGEEVGTTSVLDAAGLYAECNLDCFDASQSTQYSESGLRARHASIKLSACKDPDLPSHQCPRAARIHPIIIFKHFCCLCD